jgi:hypothetical protein
MDKFLTKIFIDKNYKRPAIFNSSKTMRFETEPKLLFSYEEIIGEITIDEDILIFDKTKKGGNFFSMTTSQQINKVINFLEENKIEYNLIDFN